MWWPARRGGSLITASMMALSMAVSHREGFAFCFLFRRICSHGGDDLVRRICVNNFIYLFYIFFGCLIYKINIFGFGINI